MFKRIRLHATVISAALACLAPGFSFAGPDMPFRIPAHSWMHASTHAFKLDAAPAVTEPTIPSVVDALPNFSSYETDPEDGTDTNDTEVPEISPVPGVADAATTPPDSAAPEEDVEPDAPSPELTGPQALAADSMLDAAPETELADSTVVSTGSEAAETAASLEAARDERESRFSVSYFSVLYGPSVGKPGSQLPDSSGNPDKEHSVYTKNFLNAGYALTEQIGISATAFWLYRPVRGQDLSMVDPYLRLSHNSLVHVGDFNWYGDLRTHLPVTKVSHDNDMKLGVQTFHIATQGLGDFLIGTYASARINFYGKNGGGNDAEFYLGPNVSYSLSRSFALTVLYEMETDHPLGNGTFEYVNGGSDLQPGFTWEITRNLTINPYLNVITSNKVSWRTTTLGFSLFLQLW